jgi:Immunoglobulin domain/Galactose oxidase, central domain
MSKFPAALAACVVLAVLAVTSTSREALGQCTGWNQIQAVGPSIRSSHSMVFDTTRGRAVLFGGYGPKPDGSEYLGDLWEFDGTTWFLRTTTGPAARQNAAMAFDIARNRSVLFGGMSHAAAPTTYGQTWEWNGTTWTTVSTTGPSARYLHAMAYDAARGNTVLFGGLADGSFRDTNTWIWNGSTWTAATAVGPAARFGHAMAYDAARQRVVLFGGFGGAGVIKELQHDTWEWNGAAWTLVSTTGPLPRQFHSMAYDATRQRVVLMGGRNEDGSTINDLWEWNGTAWTLISAALPSARESAAMVFDSTRQRLLVAGGFSERGRLGDAWERSAGTGTMPVLTVSPTPRRLLPGGTVVLSASATGSGPLAYQWLRNGSNVLNGPRTSGATTPTLTIVGAEYFDSGQYSIRVSNTCGSVTSAPVLLDVRCPADLDNGSQTGVRDGAVDVSDLIAFLTFFEQGGPLADIDNGTNTGTPDGGVDSSDLTYFLRRFDIGC